MFPWVGGRFLSCSESAHHYQVKKNFELVIPVMIVITEPNAEKRNQLFIAKYNTKEK